MTHRLKRKKGKKANKPEPRWKYLERVTAVLEQSFDRDAEIKRNEILPELLNPKARRECDVTVRTGPSHRRSLTIVEVQKRARKVEIATLDGWIGKMRVVGAQHLIAVSEKGFSATALERARQVGPSVRLATLRELKRHDWPHLGVGRMVAQVTKLESIDDLEFMVQDFSPVLGKNGQIDFDARAFRLGFSQPRSLNEIACEALSGYGTLPVGEHRLSWEASDLYAFDRVPEAGPMRFRMTLVVTKTEHELVTELRGYEQVADEGARSWVMTGRTQRGTNFGDREMHIVFRPGSDGRLHPRLAQIDGLDERDVVNISGFPSGLKVAPLREKT